MVVVAKELISIWCVGTGLVGHAVDDTMGRRWKKFVTFESPRDENRLPSKDGRLWDHSGDE